jgi:hypothetical protein
MQRMRDFRHTDAANRRITRASSSTTRIDVSRQPHFRLSSTFFVCRASFPAWPRGRRRLAEHILTLFADAVIITLRAALASAAHAPVRATPAIRRGRPFVSPTISALCVHVVAGELKDA